MTGGLPWTFSSPRMSTDRPRKNWKKFAAGYRGHTRTFVEVFFTTWKTGYCKSTNDCAIPRMSAARFLSDGHSRTYVNTIRGGLFAADFRRGHSRTSTADIRRLLSRKFVDFYRGLFAADILGLSAADCPATLCRLHMEWTNYGFMKFNWVISDHADHGGLVEHIGLMLDSGALRVVTVRLPIASRLNTTATVHQWRNFRMKSANST